MRIVVTGASKGIGYATAQALGKAGHEVYGLSRSCVENPHFQSRALDVTNKAHIAEVIGKIIAENGPIDVLVNNAGMGMVGAVEDATPEDIHRIFELNLVGAVQMISAVLPSMREQKYGRIINISSIGSEMGLPFRGFYSASKSALDKVTEAMRYEIRPWNIQATSLHLGDVKTDIAEGRVRSQISQPYQKIFDRIYQSMNADVDAGYSADQVGAYIVQLLRKEKWKPHYYFGKFGQKIGVPLKWLLPQQTYEYLMRKYSKID